jgi:hypothetical protein
MPKAHLVALPVAAFLSAAAPAPTTTTLPQQPPRTAAPDPNQVICEKQEVVGSRLAVRRVCKTRAQWADDRLQDRQEVEKVQIQRGIKAE